MSRSAESRDRAKATATPTSPAVVLIFEVNIKSSTIAKITDDMIIETRAVAPFFKNGFVLGCEETREAVLIDPGDEIDELLAVAATPRARRSPHPADPRPRRSHHRRGGSQDRRSACRCICIADDLFLYDNAVTQGAMFGLQVTQPPPVDRFYSPGQVITFGACEVRPLHTPGHCPGGVCLQVTKQGTARRSCSSATRCLPARSAGPTYPAATTTP